MERPRVITCNIVSVDGRLTIAPDVNLLTGDDRWTAIAGDADPYQWVRDIHDPDVLLEGSGSFPSDGSASDDYPAPTVPAEHFLPAEVTDVEQRRWMAVVDGHGRVRLQFTEWPDPAWAGWHAIVLTSRAASQSHLQWLRDHGIPYLVVGDGPVDLLAALRLLGTELGVRTVVATGGGRLGGALLRAGLVDEVDLEVLPAVIGGRGTPALFDAVPLTPSQAPVQLELLSIEADDNGHVRVRYAVKRQTRRERL